MATPYDAAARAVCDRLRVVLSEGALALYDGDPVRVPVVSFGIGPSRPPFLVWVNPLARSVSTSGSATSHEYSTAFSIFVYLMATHADLDEAVRNVNTWLNSAYMGIAAEATLGRSVDCAVPRISDSGYDTTPDKKHVVAAELEVACRVASVCPHEFKELIANAQAKQG